MEEIVFLKSCTILWIIIRQISIVISIYEQGPLYTRKLRNEKKKISRLESGNTSISFSIDLEIIGLIERTDRCVLCNGRVTIWEKSQITFIAWWIQSKPNLACYINVCEHCKQLIGTISSFGVLPQYQICSVPLPLHK